MHNARGFERDEDDDSGRSFPYRLADAAVNDDEDDRMQAERWNALDPVAEESTLMSDALREGYLTAPESFSDQLQRMFLVTN
ncbi:hypothetical protein BV898_09785 [Hypsibius exemplaris]|uniref:Uncharacterized protein n=1 Tax=Hypsibius exemplaris TaxID=2072580 RepID=A0A1W0WLR2_HYPEX|nr:hypothetical protein BV898_09785 [Hypsibius exemplaris]